MPPLIAATMVLAVLVSAGAIALVRRTPLRPAAASAPTPSTAVAARPPARRPLPAPKLLATPLGEAERPAAGATIDDLRPDQRDTLERLERTARERAAASLGLTAEEMADVAEIHRRADLRRAQLEAQVDAATGLYLPEALAALHRSEMTALHELTRALDPARARQVRRAEAAAYDHAWEELARDEGTPPALAHVAHRRMMFLCSGTAQAEGEPPALPPPSDEEDATE